MPGVLLGKDASKNARGKRVWLPPGAMKDLRADVISTCLMVTDMEGTVCGAQFTRGQEVRVEQHAILCGKLHGDTAEAYLKVRRPDGMKPWDPEYANWLARNRIGINEGRVKW